MCGCHHIVLQSRSEVALTKYSGDKGRLRKGPVAVLSDYPRQIEGFGRVHLAAGMILMLCSGHVVMSFESSRAYLYSVALLALLGIGALVSLAYSKIGLSAYLGAHRRKLFEISAAPAVLGITPYCGLIFTVGIGEDAADLIFFFLVSILIEGTVFTILVRDRFRNLASDEKAWIFAFLLMFPLSVAYFLQYVVAGLQ